MVEFGTKAGLPVHREKSLRWKDRYVQGEAAFLYIEKKKKKKKGDAEEAEEKDSRSKKTGWRPPSMRLGDFVLDNVVR